MTELEQKSKIECFFNYPVELELNLLSSNVKLLMKRELNVWFLLFGMDGLKRSI